MLVAELETTTIPELRLLIASKVRKNKRDELKRKEEALKSLLEKLKMTA